MGTVMLTMILTLNGWAERWLATMGAFVWQSTLLVVIATLAAWLLKRSSPQVRYWLWQIVVLKLLLMPFWSFYVPLPTWAEKKSPSQSVAMIAVPTELPSQPVFRLPDRMPIDSIAVPSFWEPPTAMTWRAWLFVAWSAVVFWQLIRLLNQHVRLARLLKQGIPPDKDLAGLIAELAGQLGLRRRPVAVSVAADCPLFVCGFWQPRLVLPDRLMASLSPSERRQVIFHELAHIKRHDLFWGWPVEIARMAYFFHPLVYWAAYQFRLERELCCDQLAMASSGHPPADYAQTLVQVVAHASEPVAVIAAGVTGGEGQRPVPSPSPGHRPGERRDE